MELVNLSPHKVDIVSTDGNVVLTIKSSGEARAKQADQSAGEVEFGGIVIPVITTVFGETENLPEPTEGVGYIVSVITVTAAKSCRRDTSDLYTVGQIVRDPDGNIVGARALVRN